VRQAKPGRGGRPQLKPLERALAGRILPGKAGHHP
jgi:hypothetical protein